MLRAGLVSFFHVCDRAPRSVCGRALGRLLDRAWGVCTWRSGRERLLARGVWGGGPLEGKGRAGLSSCLVYRYVQCTGLRWVPRWRVGWEDVCMITVWHWRLHDAHGSGWEMGGCRVAAGAPRAWVGLKVCGGSYRIERKVSAWALLCPCYLRRTPWRMAWSCGLSLPWRKALTVMGRPRHACHPSIAYRILW